MTTTDTAVTESLALSRVVLRGAVAVVLVALAAWWPFQEIVPRGPILVTIAKDRGIDLTDLLALPLLAVAVWLVVPRRSARSEGD